jgi:hypothetical protein
MTPTGSRAGYCSRPAAPGGSPAVHPVRPPIGPTPTSSWPLASEVARACRRRSASIRGCSSPSPPPASARSTAAGRRGAWCCLATHTAKVPAAPMVCGMAAGTAMARMTLGWASRCMRPATTARPRCSGTRSPPSCGDGPPSPSGVPWAGWSASRRGSYGGWSGSPMPRWPSSSDAGRSTSMP